MSAELLVNRYAMNALFIERAELSPVVPWITQWLWIPAVFPATTFLPLTFPNGRLPSPRWRPVAWLAAITFVLELLPANALRPGPLVDPYSDIVNPFGLAGAVGDFVLLVGEGAVHFAWVAAILLTVAAVVARYRAAGSVERQQLKWLAYAAALQALTMTAIVVLQELLGTRLAFDILGPLIGVFGAGMPIAAGVAILRYRLYEVDLVINRTLVYGALTASLALTYWGGVVLLQQVLRPFTQGSDLAIIGSTLLVAALFQPARLRIQAAVDRRFYRNKYDAARTLEAFSARLRDEVDLEALADALQRVVVQTMRPTHVSLWMRAGERAASNSNGAYDG